MICKEDSRSKSAVSAMLLTVQSHLSLEEPELCKITRKGVPRQRAYDFQE